MASISSAFKVTMSAASMKALPIIIGMIVLSTFGDVVFSEFSYFITSVSFVVVLISTGLVPSLIRELCKSSDKNERQFILEKYLRTSYTIGLIILFFLVISVELELYLISKLTETFIVAFSIVTVVLCYSTLQAVGNINLSFLVCLLNSFIILFSVYLSSFYSVDVVYCFYVLSYLFLAIFNLVLMSNFGFLSKSLFDVKNLKRDFIYVYRSTFLIFFSNLIWMASIFLFHSLLIKNDSSKALYTSFAIAYQLFTLVVFVPGALAPLIISGLKNNLSIYSIFKLSFLYFMLGLGVALISFFFSGVLEFFYNYDFSERQLDIVLFTLISASFSAASAPFIQFLISIGKEYYIALAAIVWSLCALQIFYFGSWSSVFELYFLLGHILSFLSLLVFSVYESKIREAA